MSNLYNIDAKLERKVDLSKLRLSKDETLKMQFRGVPNQSCNEIERKMVIDPDFKDDKIERSVHPYLNSNTAQYEAFKRAINRSDVVKKQTSSYQVLKPVTASQDFKRIRGLYNEQDDNKVWLDAKSQFKFD